MPRPTPLATLVAGVLTSPAAAAPAAALGGSAGGTTAAGHPAPRGTARVPAPAGVPLTLAGLAFLLLAVRRAAVHVAAVRAMADGEGAGRPVATEGW